MILSLSLSLTYTHTATRCDVHCPHANDERAAVPGREPGWHVHQVPDGPGTTASLPGDPSFHGDAPAHAKREQPPGEAAAFR